MKKIEAIIKPYRLEEVRQTLSEIGVTHIIAQEVKGYGRRMNPVSLYKTKKGTNIILECVPKVEIYIIVEDEIAEKVVDCIIKAASSVEIGDGKIFITEVYDSIDIRSGERGYCGNPG